MKFSSVLGFVAGLAGLSTALAAPYGGHHGGHGGHGSSETVTIAEATILIEESTNNYYITFEAVELVEVVEESSSGYKARSNEVAARQPWGYGSSNYGSHVTIAEEIVLVEVVSQKRYRTVTAIAVAEYINISSRDLEARHNYDHSHRHNIAISVEEVIVINGQHYTIVEATSVQVYFQSGSSKREALPAPGHGGHGSHGGHGGHQTITIAAEEEIFVNNNYYQVAVAIEVVVEVSN